MFIFAIYCVLVTNSYKGRQWGTLALPCWAGYRQVPQKNTPNTKQQFTVFIEKEKGATS